MHRTLAGYGCDSYAASVMLLLAHSYGYDKYGYDKYGYDKYGYDKYGYGKDSYHKDGYDRYRLTVHLRLLISDRAPAALVAAFVNV
jgi:hypothetical protein